MTENFWSPYFANEGFAEIAVVNVGGGLPGELVNEMLLYVLPDRRLRLMRFKNYMDLQNDFMS